MILRATVAVTASEAHLHTVPAAARCEDSVLLVDLLSVHTAVFSATSHYLMTALVQRSAVTSAVQLYCSTAVCRLCKDNYMWSDIANICNHVIVLHAYVHMAVFDGVAHSCAAGRQAAAAAPLQSLQASCS